MIAGDQMSASETAPLAERIDPGDRIFVVFIRRRGLHGSLVHGTQEGTTPNNANLELVPKPWQIVPVPGRDVTGRRALQMWAAMCRFRRGYGCHCGRYQPAFI